ncbi:hypothetical protein ACFCZ1_15785 [Streptomyces sp. NPDC056224]|uniref:hypothetical protein n=1 Tax=Streptomyces sp. NPDC056224 TaxID=3345750 RepID=UPI0035D958D3
MPRLRPACALAPRATGPALQRIALGGATTASLGFIPGPLPLLVVLAILAGVVRGNLTLLQATAVTDRWGTTQYGRLSALLSAPAHIAAALAPSASAALAVPLGGCPHLFAALAALSVVAACPALLASREGRTRPLSRSVPGGKPASQGRQHR